MIDKISKLAKGILDTEAPEIRILPEAVEAQLSADRDASFVLEIVSTNGNTIKGLCYTEDPRIRSDQKSFVGRRIHLTFRAETKLTAPGEVLEGRIILVTNAGEMSVPYRVQTDAASGEPEEEEILFEDSPLKMYDRMGAAAQSLSAEMLEQQKWLAARLPQDEPLFEGLLKALIRVKDTSPLAFAVYREAIRRDYQVTRLYESYVAAYPSGSDEMMPREVLLYFSYGGDPPEALCTRLYRNVLLYVDRDSELYAGYEAKISRFAMQNALAGRIDDDLALIYDRMIFPGMIDRRAAEILPDILKCRRIETEGLAYGTVTVGYPELKSALTAPIRGGLAFVPVYFDNAVLRFYDASGRECTGNIQHTDTPILRKPELIRRCFELLPEHKMLLLSAVREITGRGIADEQETDICLRALHTLPLTRSFRGEVVRTLSRAGGVARWAEVLLPEDYTRDAAAEIWQALMDDERLLDAWRLIRQYPMDLSGRENTLLKLSDGLITKGAIPMEGEASDPYFIALCKRLLDQGLATDVIVSFLASVYEGETEEMYRIMDQALGQTGRAYELPEKVLAFLLFTGSRRHIDETFSAYIHHCKYQELMLKAYLNVRSADYFLYEQEVIGSIFFEALESYILAVEDPLKLPELMLLSMTKHYSEMDQLNETETDLCQKLTDYLTGQGLVFCYTKRLKRKIRISQEIRERFYIEYHGREDVAPRMLVRVMPDESSFHYEEMKRVFHNIYVSSCILFMGDELHYLIYNTPSDKEPSEEGMIKVTKFHKLKDDRFENLNHMMKALSEKDAEQLKEYMLQYVETEERMKQLFTL